MKTNPKPCPNCGTVTKRKTNPKHCPNCGNTDLDVGEDRWIQVDSPNMPFKLFCNWKHLGRWITETYEKGDQFKEKLEEGDE